VFLVMYLFLQNLRATLIPTLAVPVVLLGRRVDGRLSDSRSIRFRCSGWSSQSAAGRRCDRRRPRTSNRDVRGRLSPIDATRKAMGQITSALVGVAVVLARYSSPMAFSAGSVGAIYRQFSLTIVTACAFRVVALSLTRRCVPWC